MPPKKKPTGQALRELPKIPKELLEQFTDGPMTAEASRPGRAKTWLSRLQACNLDAHPELASGLPLIHAAVATQEDDSELTIRLLEPVRDAPMDNPFLRYVLLAALTVAYATAGRYADARRLFDTHPITPRGSKQ